MDSDNGSEDDSPEANPVKMDEDWSSDDSDSDDSSSDDDAPPKKAKTSSTLQLQTSGSKILFMKNISYDIHKSEVELFFKGCGVVDVRLALYPNGTHRGFGQVEFATVKSAKKALEEKNGQVLAGREVCLDFDGEWLQSRYANSNQGSGCSQPRLTIFVKGLDTNSELYPMKDALREHFSCGKANVFVPTSVNGGLRGTTFIDFSSRGEFTRALKLDQSELNGHRITVQEATSRGYSSLGDGFFQRRPFRGRNPRPFRGRNPCGRFPSTLSLTGKGKKTTFGDD